MVRLTRGARRRTRLEPKRTLAPSEPQRLALWIAVVEAALVVFDVFPRWPAFVLGLALLAFYVVVGRNVRNDTIRQASWIAAVSQLLIVALPLILLRC